MILEWVKVCKPARPLRYALNSAVKRVLQVYCIEIQNFVQCALLLHKSLQLMVDDHFTHLLTSHILTLVRHCLHHMTPDKYKYSKNESYFHAKLTVWTLSVETESCKD